MKKTELLKKIKNFKQAKDDLEIDEYDGVIHITLNDFLGFGERGEEISNDFEIDWYALKNFLNDNCQENQYDNHFIFEDCQVETMMASEDI